MGNRQDTYIHDTVSCLGVWNKNDEEEEEEQQQQQQQNHHFTPETPPIILDFLASPHLKKDVRPGGKYRGQNLRYFHLATLRSCCWVSCGDGTQKKTIKINKSTEKKHPTVNK
jgi:hypothetical protein